MDGGDIQLMATIKPNMRIMEKYQVICMINSTLEFLLSPKSGLDQAET